MQPTDHQEIREEIARYIDFDKFIRIENRLQELRAEEDSKLAALAELQKRYVAANSDFEREAVKQTVGKIRDLSKIHRQEIRALHSELEKYLPVKLAEELYIKLSHSGG